jgi:hypothetical protein
MNPSEEKLNRVLEAAQSARPPIPHPSPWFEQRMVQALKAEETSFFGFLDVRLIFRAMAFASVIAAVSISLPLIQATSPYADVLNLADTGLRWEQSQ